MSYPQDVSDAIAKVEAGSSPYLKVVISEGSGGNPPAGKQMTMHYTGTLTDGKKFDSSRDKGRTFSFELGAGRVIKGWDEGVATMKK
eukprot:Awhi_evm1s9806